jgi:flagellin-like protein
MKKLFRNRKAVSPVIATVLMILVTMAGMTILFGFVISYSDSYKAGIGTSVMESLTIEDVLVSGPEGTVQISIYNAATKANLGTDVYLNVATIYVDNLALINPDNPGSINFYNKDKPLEAGKHMVFTGSLPSTNPYLSEGPHDITIVTYRGSNFKDQFNVP